MSDESGGKALGLVLGLFKAAFVVVGFPLTIFCLAAIVGVFLDSGWLQLAIALVAAIALPLVMVVWILPDGGDPIKSRRLAGWLFAVAYIALPVYFQLADHSAMFAAQGKQLTDAEYPRLSQVAYWLAGKEAPTPLPKIAGSGTQSPKTKNLRPEESSSQRPGVILTRPGKESESEPSKPSNASSSKHEFTPAELFAKWSGSIVAISVSKGTFSSGSGSGFYVDKKGTVVTNHHVIKDATRIRVRNKAGTWHEDVKVLSKDATVDLALLSTKPAKPTPSVVLGDSQAVVVGQQVIAIGNPMGLDFSVTDGLVSQRRILNGRKWIQISVPISPGNSGGPLINRRGEVIGVNTAGLSAPQAQNINLAVPVNEVKKMIKELGRSSRGPNNGNEASNTW